MKKFVLNISDSTYEKLRFEAINEKKSIQEIISERIFYKPFSEEVIQAFNEWVEKELESILEEV